MEQEERQKMEEKSESRDRRSNKGGNGTEVRQESKRRIGEQTKFYLPIFPNADVPKAIVLVCQ